MDELSKTTENFLLEYASGKFGKCGEVINITKKVVEEFMEKSTKEDMEEIISYIQFSEEMIQDNRGSLDLEDYIDYVIN